MFYKCEQNGISVVENEEAYTSKCDALGLEKVGFNDTYVGRRIKRGLFSSSKQVLINADVNGAINIMRKHLMKVSSSLSEKLDFFLQQTPLSRFCNPVTLGRKLDILTPKTIVQEVKQGLVTAL